MRKIEAGLTFDWCYYELLLHHSLFMHLKGSRLIVCFLSHGQHPLDKAPRPGSDPLYISFDVGDEIQEQSSNSAQAHYPFQPSSVHNGTLITPTMLELLVLETVGQSDSVTGLDGLSRTTPESLAIRRSTSLERSRRYVTSSWHPHPDPSPTPSWETFGPIRKASAAGRWDESKEVLVLADSEAEIATGVDDAACHMSHHRRWRSPKEIQAFFDPISLRTRRAVAASLRAGYWLPEETGMRLGAERDHVIEATTGPKKPPQRQSKEATEAERDRKLRSYWLGRRCSCNGSHMRALRLLVQRVGSMESTQDLRKSQACLVLRSCSWQLLASSFVALLALQSRQSLRRRHLSVSSLQFPARQPWPGWPQSECTASTTSHLQAISTWHCPGCMERNSLLPNIGQARRSSHRLYFSHGRGSLVSVDDIAFKRLPPKTKALSIVGKLEMEEHRGLVQLLYDLRNGCKKLETESKKLGPVQR
ncbi:hypothetical protein SISNIDRAFT_494680 [Sistotremastrum niveocremeum HHB9708]|uniref:Uncharacterized protein n=1 Tax=Sistotremastrum niveocremeum HHB9708 TaxID=1314777 RepID=A0A164W350_9AGAM|nr:hypothetical protein SISNIDRAFT_494680 [Sistotremastrum niveocremeum HHB9708]